MSEKVVDDLAKVIKSNGKLQELRLSSNNLQSPVVVILQALKAISSLKVLSLNRNNMSEKVVNDLADVIKSNVRLEELHLDYNNLQSSAVVVLQALKAISSLKILNLKSNNMSGKVVDDLADVIKNNTCLEELHLDNNNLHTSAVVILQALKAISSLKVLSLNSNSMSEKVVDDLADVIKSNGKLEKFRLSYNGLQSSAIVILQALKAISSLKVLSLNSNNMSEKVVDDLAKVINSNDKLQELRLNYNNLQSSAVVILQALKAISSLTVLSLNSNNMSGKMVDDLADVIKNNTCLEELHLDNNDLQSSAVVILQALKAISSLKVLSLNRNNISEKAVDDLAEVIKSNGKLQELRLSYNNLQSSVVVVLQALKGTKSLKKLDLDGNNMSGKVVDDLADVIKNNTCLEELNLSCNNLQSSAVIILQALKQHQVLEY